MKKTLIILLVIIILISQNILSQEPPGDLEGETRFATAAKAEQRVNEEVGQADGEVLPTTVEEPAHFTPTSPDASFTDARTPGFATVSYSGGNFYSTQFTSVETRSGITGSNINNAIIRSDGSINAIFAQILKFLGIDGNEVEMEDADKIDIKSNGDYSIESVRQLNSPALTIINGQNIVSEGNHIYVGHSQRLDYLDVASQNVDDFESFARDEFTVSN